MSKLEELRDRVRAATGPDRELDFQVHKELCSGDYFGRWIWDDELRPPKLTASVDAALALVERMLPGMLWSVCDMEEGPFAQIIAANKKGSYSNGLSQGKGATPPLAVLDALLTALIARETSHDR